MTTRIDEIASDIYRISTYTDDIPGGFTFNQFLIRGEQPLLFHTGLRATFPLVSEALERVCPVDQIRWVSFGHWEADEAGAMNLWLQHAPAAEVAVGTLGVMISGGDQADRPPRVLGDGEVLDLGGKRVRWIDTPHVPHGWDAGLLYEETTETLFCGDLLSHLGHVEPLTEQDVLDPAITAEDTFHSTSLTPLTAPTIRMLADLNPATLAIMHGASYRGDGATALRSLADEYEGRLRAAMPVAS
ncbi:MAG: MBL fold metallo-hydrolase [Frankiaceae bacterium]|nr:MBL fold metallo-hydrolase [Frankiaceae bacterium]